MEQYMQLLGIVVLPRVDYRCFEGSPAKLCCARHGLHQVVPVILAEHGREAQCGYVASEVVSLIRLIFARCFVGRIELSSRALFFSLMHILMDQISCEGALLIPESFFSKGGLEEGEEGEVSCRPQFPQCVIDLLSLLASEGNPEALTIISIWKTCTHRQLMKLIAE